MEKVTGDIFNISLDLFIKCYAIFLEILKIKLPLLFL
jgi:hypothetical protein